MRPVLQRLLSSQGARYPRDWWSDARL